MNSVIPMPNWAPIRAVVVGAVCLAPLAAGNITGIGLPARQALIASVSMRRCRNPRYRRQN